LPVKILTSASRPNGYVPRSLLIILLAFNLVACDHSKDVGFRKGSPLDDLPAWITPLLASGLRPDWSADGSHLLYLDALVGNVHELELASGESKSLTGHFKHHGFTRARYLHSGDLLLCGPGSAADHDAEQGRWETELWFLPRDGLGPPQRLGEPCFEGPAVSRRDMRIAWTVSDYPNKIVFARSEIWLGRIVVNDGNATIIDKRKLVGREDFMYLAFLESQDFHPPEENELIFTAYAYKGGEVMGVNLHSGEITNYSRDWAYDEAEAVFPDGKSVAIEREVHTYTAVPEGDIDLWQLALDESGTSRRLTYFSEYAGFGANNPAISPDGRKMAFGLRVKGGAHGNAQGMLLYDFDKAPR
jgi:hypothetical protein